MNTKVFETIDKRIAENLQEIKSLALKSKNRKPLLVCTRGQPACHPARPMQGMQ
jgi:hypothetical protein